MPESVTSDGEKAVAVLRKGKIRLFDWQADILDAWLGRDGEGQWAAGTCGLSVPRQNGKSLLAVGRICWGMVAYGEWVVYTAHLQKTATETFQAVRDFFTTPAMAKYIVEIKAALGREEVVLTTGGRVKFLARTRNGGRGQHGDLLVFDEGQEVDGDMQASFIPAISASRNPQVVYIGTPPDEACVGDAFKRLRLDAKSGASRGLCWHEWALDTYTVDQLADEGLWARQNPSMGVLIKPKVVRDLEYGRFPADKFARERLGWWQADKMADSPIPIAAWNRCKVAKAPDGLVCYAVKFAPDSSTVSLSVAVKPEVGAVFVEGIACKGLNEGTQWLVDWLVERKDKAAQIVVDGRSGSQALIDKLRARGVASGAIIAPSASNLITAISGFSVAVIEQTVTHAGQPGMTASATKTLRRKIGNSGGWGFQTTEQGDATLIESAALAWWAVTTTKRRPGRKAVVL